jgi:hypothetical protein
VKRVAEAGNTEVPASLVLEQKGYAIRREISAGGEDWIAERGDISCCASSVLSLLGLVTMVEARGEHWAAPDEAIELFLKQHGLN